jgi:hypothetical protein
MPKMPTASSKFAKTARNDKEGRVIYTRTGAKTGCDYVRRKDPSTGAMVFRKVAQKKKFRGGFSCKYGTTSHNSKQMIYAFPNDQYKIEVDVESPSDDEKYGRTLANIENLIERLSKLVPPTSSCKTNTTSEEGADDKEIQPSDEEIKIAVEIDAVLAGLRSSRSNSGIGTGAGNGRISDRRQQILEVADGTREPTNTSIQPQRQRLRDALNRLNR